MLSLNSQNQVRDPLTSTTPRFQNDDTVTSRLQLVCSLGQVSRHLALFKSNKKRTTGERRTAATSNSTILCEDSLIEAAAKCTAPFFQDMQKALASRSVGYSSRTPLRDACDSLDPWLVSYVSRDTFTANKNFGMFRSHVDVDRLLKTTQFFRYVSSRGFKTDRTVVSELERNPNLWQRLKKAMGMFVFDDFSSESCLIFV